MREIFLLDERFLKVIHSDDVDDLGFRFGSFLFIIVFQESDFAIFEETQV